MRFARTETDYWELRSGENAHAENPEQFWIPSLQDRQTLKVGQSVKLIFDIETFDEEEKEIVVSGERMWVIISEYNPDYYIGILDNQPACIEASDSVYLVFGAEIPFRAEHVIDIGNPPADYVEWQLSQPPERIWPR